MNQEAVLTFWFEELTPKDWFEVNTSVDKAIYERFLDVHQEITRGEHTAWRETPNGMLALIIVLDQFSRNMFRGTPESFANDEMALMLAKEAVEKGFDLKISEERRAFIYMPYMHSESKEVHETALELFEKFGNEHNLKYEKLHKKIIDRFGRYPHRNEILGRNSTAEEQEFLDNDENSSF